MTKHFSCPRQGFQDFNAVLIMNLEGSSFSFSFSLVRNSLSLCETDLRPGKLERVSMYAGGTRNEPSCFIIVIRILTLQRDTSESAFEIKFIKQKIFYTFASIQYRNKIFCFPFFSTP